MSLKRATAIIATCAIFAACAGDGRPSEPAVLLELPGAAPGDTVGLIAVERDADDRSVWWIDRLAGTVLSLDIDAGNIDDDIDGVREPEVIATIPIGTDGEQRGLLGQVVIDGRHFASWTRPDTFELVVGEVVDGAPGPIVWSAGAAGTGAIGGVLDELDGRIVLGLGRNTASDRESDVGGAILLLDPDGPVEQEPEVVSVGYTNPWAFTVTDNGEIWAADNAAGPDPADATVDDIERTGRADLLADRADMRRITEPGRAPSAMVELPDGRLGVCGFLDNELLAYEIVDGSDADPTNPATEELPRSELARIDVIMPCLTGAAIFDDDTIVTAAQSESGEALQILHP